MTTTTALGHGEAGNSQKTRRGGGGRAGIIFAAPSWPRSVQELRRQTRNRITTTCVYKRLYMYCAVARRVVWPLVSMMLLSYLGLSRAYQSPAAPLTEALMVLLLQRRLAAPRAAVGTSRSLCKQSSGVHSNNSSGSSSSSISSGRPTANTYIQLAYRYH
uniref:Uncharacterized protein n=1 Tax=Trichogramma kaykai TaxID=54128 RepID=A0ABD2X7L3_9HYME